MRYRPALPEAINLQPKPALLLNGLICVYLRQPCPPSNLTALSFYLTTAVLNDCYSEVTAYTALAYSVFMMPVVKLEFEDAGAQLK